MSTNEPEALVAGAGIWGCTVARVLAEAGKRVRVLEKRPVPGGNVRCEIDPETGIEVHRYGSHIFHTHLPQVWSFVNRFVTFNGYQHKVLAHYQGKTYFLPLGLALINKFFGTELTPAEVAPFMRDADHARAIFDAFFRGYSAKQWGVPAEQVDESIIRRVPVRENYDINYFSDTLQGIPSEGYNALFDRLLDHPGITLSTNTPFELSNSPQSIPVFYSGPLDALFNFKLGYLPWRTLRFVSETLPQVDFQGTSVVNYTEASVPYTRIHEFKHYHPEARGTGSWGVDAAKTLIMREYPAAWQPGDEPYYPIASSQSAALVAAYRAEAAQIPNLILGGRLGEYQYYDMDRSVASALETAHKALATWRW